MSIGSDSQVVDALHDERALERVLVALGCSIETEDGRGFRNGATIHCPLPDHPDVNPSCTVRASLGQFFCQSVCDRILPSDLVVAHGKASDRAGAMKWLEEVLGLERAPLPPMVPQVDDPSLTVEQYLAMKGLPDWIAEKFGLETVRIWQAGADKKTKHAAYVTDWYSAVFMPMREGRRPRVRSEAPGVKIKWCPKARHLDGRMEDWSVDSRNPGPVVEWPLDVIGMDQFESILATDPSLAPVLVVVEGESDVHAMHAMSLPFVIGMPGSKMPTRLKPEMLEACLHATQGDTNLSELTVVVWQEPGSAGAKFPRDVADAIAEAALEAGFPSPKFVTLHHGSVPTAPKDPSALLLDRPADLARRQLTTAIIAALPQAGVAASIGDASARTAIAVNAQAALDVLQVDGHATPPPATDDTTENEVELPANLPPGWSAEALAAHVAAAKPPSYMLGNDRSSAGPAALWSAYDDVEDPPARDLAPERVDGISGQFIRTSEGWSMEKIDKDGDATMVPICTAFVVERVERCGAEILVRVASPFGGAWNRVRLSMSATADAGRTCGMLAQVGVVVANRQRPAVTDLLLALTRWQEQETGAIAVPSGTGWAGRPGTSPFGGIEVEPVNEFGARMFEANERRRERRPDTLAAAREWWEAVVNPLLVPVEGAEGMPASSVAPLLALGAAAAAPLIGPLSDVGIAVAPVVWIAGLGGGGKSVTQKLAASIFAPSLPDLDGQSAYFANANISQAALSARVDSCRDLPLILDDVTQLPPLPGSTSRGDSARIEAAAALGMMVFNRKPIERATRDGGIRQTRAFRSSAIFSAEVSMSSESSKAVVTAGHRRRISTIEARPMSERGLGNAYAELVNDYSASVGGAPGELLVGRIREVVADLKTRGLFESVRRSIAAMPESESVTLTQREALAVNVLGFALLAESAAGWTMTDTVNLFLHQLGPYMAVGAGAGGATRDDELAGTDAALRAVIDLTAVHPLRFESYKRDDVEYFLPPPTAGYLGKEVRPLYDGSRRIVLFRPGMAMLENGYGVTSQVVQQAISEGKVKMRHQVRLFGGERAYGVLWTLPPQAEQEEDVDPTLPPGHDPDPHGLATNDEPYIPGTGGLARAVQFEYQGGVMPHFNEVPSLDDFSDALVNWMRGDYERVRTYTEDDGTITVTHMGWGSGTYVVPHGPAGRSDAKLLARIQMEARHELEALQLQYAHAAEKNPDHTALVAPVPPEGDPRWERIDALGPDEATRQWKAVNEALYQAGRQVDPALKMQWHTAHIKAYRIHVMCRMRHPEWFVRGHEVA